MQLSLIRTLPEMDTLANEWNQLLECSASAVPFLRHEYLRAWWQTLGGGEWPHGELCIVTARQDGILRGIAPLFFTNNRDNEPALMLLGSIEISDYLDVIACREDVSTFLDELIRFLDSPQAPAWQVLDWYNLLDSSPTLPGLEAIAAQREWPLTRELLQHCPYIPLPGDWEKYLTEQVDKKQRHEIRRKMRRIEEFGSPVRWYIVEDEANLDTEIEDFLQMMANEPEKAHFLTDSMRQQMHLALQAAFHCGWLQLAFIEIGGEKAASYINFDFGNQIWVYNSGLDYKFREYSPGWVLLGYLLQWANQHQRTCFDFMRGDEEYKYRFGAVDRRIVRVKVRRSNESTIR
jgi:CelD/BcsL family acetyltransferase involved in cellulose biosynthesis